MIFSLFLIKIGQRIASSLMKIINSCRFLKQPKIDNSLILILSKNQNLMVISKFKDPPNIGC